MVTLEERVPTLRIPDILMPVQSFSMSYFEDRFTGISSVEMSTSVKGFVSSRKIGILRLKDGTEERVWVEWRATRSGPEMFKANDFTQAFFLAIQLATGSAPGKISPKCVGFVGDACEHTSLYGYIFAMPENSDDETMLITLQGILGDENYRPTPPERVALAIKVAKAIQQLHGDNWLHRNIHSGNILFSLHKGELDIDNPILAGHEYPRPPTSTIRGNGVEKRLDCYRWPKLQNELPTGGASREVHDVYGLGLLLLEIGHWKRLDDLMRLKPGPRAAQVVRIRGWLIGEPFPPFTDYNPLSTCDFLPRDDENDRYRHVATRCIHACGSNGMLVQEDADQEAGSDGGQELRKAFRTSVIEELEGIKMRY